MRSNHTTRLGAWLGMCGTRGSHTLVDWIKICWTKHRLCLRLIIIHFEDCMKQRTKEFWRTGQNGELSNNEENHSDHLVMYENKFYFVFSLSSPHLSITKRSSVWRPILLIMKKSWPMPLLTSWTAALWSRPLRSKARPCSSQSSASKRRCYVKDSALLTPESYLEKNLKVRS